jgi:hypothetical protein
MLQNRRFKRFILSKTDPEVLILPILLILYNAVEARENYSQLYTLLTIILVMTQDELFNQSIHKIECQVPAWFTDKLVKTCTVGGLLMLVMIRIIQSNLARHRDVYIHTNCLAILGNLSSTITHMPMVVAQKLIALFDNGSKRYWKTPSSTSMSVEESSSTFAAEVDQRSIYGDILSLILEVINSIMTHNLKHNPQLIYSLLYGQEMFIKFRLEPRFTDLIENIDIVLTHFHSKILANEETTVSADIVLQTIQETGNQWTTGKLKLFSELKFQYEEDAEYSRFFLPYIWSLVHRHSQIYWDEKNLELIKDLDVEIPYNPLDSKP